MGDITIRKALGDYKTVYMPYRNFAVRTREEYTNDLEDFVRFVESSGIRNVGQLGLPLIQRYAAHLEQRGFASLTRKRRVVAIRSFLLFLFQDAYIDANISEKIIVPFTETTTPYVLTQGECEQLRKACTDSPRDAAIVEVLLQAGLRLSELTRLTLNDIDWSSGRPPGEHPGGFIRILGGRAKKERVVSLGFAACVAIRKYLGVRKEAAKATLFLNRFGKPLGERGVQKMLRKYLKQAGIGRASIHTLRHTFGVHQVEHGTNQKTLQDVMGLKDLRSTLVYTSFIRE